MRLRQVALAAGDLDATVAQLSAALGIRVAFNDPSVAVFGLRNAVLPVGDTFLEVVSPAQADAAAARYIARRGGDCGYMVMVQSEDTDLDRRRAAEIGVRIAWSIDLDDIRGTHLHPRDLGGALLSLDAAMPPQSWRWAGPGWERAAHTGVVRELAAVDMACADPATVAGRWAALLGRTVERGDGDTFRIPLDRGSLRFTPGKPGADGVVAVDVLATDRARAGSETNICGTRFRFV